MIRGAEHALKQYELGSKWIRRESENRYYQALMGRENWITEDNGKLLLVEHNGYYRIITKEDGKYNDEYTREQAVGSDADLAQTFSAESISRLNAIGEAVYKRYTRIDDLRETGLQDLYSALWTSIGFHEVAIKDMVFKANPMFENQEHQDSRGLYLSVNIDNIITLMLSADVNYKGGFDYNSYTGLDRSDFMNSLQSDIVHVKITR